MTSKNFPPPAPPEGLLEVLGVKVDPELLSRALTHRSYAYENGGLPTNERLEFLGDAVLGLIVTAALFRRHPDLSEGHLAKQRASVVNMRALADVARTLGLGPYLLLGRGEEATGGRDKPSILADTLEAVIGAVYLSAGLDAASSFVHRLFDPLLEEAAGRGAGLDWKTSLQEQTALMGLGPPEYVVAEAGPDHAKRFTAYARVAGESLGEGEGGSKKEAEQRAAQAAFAVLEKRSAVAAQNDLGAGAAGGSAAAQAESAAASTASSAAASAAADAAVAGPDGSHPDGRAPEGAEPAAVAQGASAPADAAPADASGASAADAAGGTAAGGGAAADGSPKKPAAPDGPEQPGGAGAPADASRDS